MFTFPVRPSAPLRTCMRAEQQSVPSTDSCSSGPAGAPCLWPPAACEEMPPVLGPHLLRRTREPVSDCSAPRCAPGEGRSCCMWLRKQQLLNVSDVTPGSDVPVETPEPGLAPSSTAASEGSGLSPGVGGNTRRGELLNCGLKTSTDNR